jgi:hypothetical protein
MLNLQEEIPDSILCGADLNGFERHGIRHSSPSALNHWAEAPCSWISTYLYGNKGKFSAAAKAGVLVEEALVNILGRGWTHENAMIAALDSYNKFIAIGATDADIKRGDGIADMISLALLELQPYGTPEFDRDGITGDLRQKKVEVTCRGDGWTLPVIGFVDFHFPKHGVIFDLKTTGKMPSEMSASHLRQQAIYRQAFGNQAVKFLYVTGKKSQVFEPPSHTETLAEIKQILNRQEKFLRLGDRELLRSVVPVSTESYYWRENEAVRREMYGI